MDTGQSGMTINTEYGPSMMARTDRDVAHMLRFLADSLEAGRIAVYLCHDAPLSEERRLLRLMYTPPKGDQ